MAEGAAPETSGHLGPVQLDGRITFSQRLVDSVFDATGVRVYYRTREKCGKCHVWTLKGPVGRLTEALELVCIYGIREAQRSAVELEAHRAYWQGYAQRSAELEAQRGPA